MTNFQKNTLLVRNFDVISVFFGSLLMFLLVIKYLSTDIESHAGQIVLINNGGAIYPPNFLFYWLTNLFSGFSNNVKIVLVAGSVMLAIANTFKYIVSKLFLGYLWKKKGDEVNQKAIRWLALLLISIFAIPDFYGVFVTNSMYAAKIVPVVWHNSTVIFLMPFSLLLFWKQLKLMDGDKENTKFQLAEVHFWVLLNVLIKPSFIFVFIPIFGLIVLYRLKTVGVKKFLIYISPLFLGGVLILLQYVLIYQFQLGSMQGEDSSVTLGGAFDYYKKWFPLWYLPVAVFFSLAFPILILLLQKESRRFTPFLYAWLLMIFAFLISGFVVESGPRSGHGNFLWQNVICAYFLMLTGVAYLWPKLKEKQNLILKWLKFVFYLHAASGIIYILKMFVTGSYA